MNYYITTLRHKSPSGHVVTFDETAREGISEREAVAYFESNLKAFRADKLEGTYTLTCGETVLRTETL